MGFETHHHRLPAAVPARAKRESFEEGRRFRILFISADTETVYFVYLDNEDDILWIATDNLKIKGNIPITNPGGAIVSFHKLP